MIGRFRANRTWSRHRRRAGFDPSLPFDDQICRTAREEAERKEREEALERDKAQVAEIKAAQARTADAQARIASSQRITRWAFAAVAAVILIAGSTVALLQWYKDRQLKRQEVALAHARANLLGEFSRTEQSRGELDSALRLALHGTQIDLALPSSTIKVSPAVTALAAAHESALASAAFSPDGSRIVTASSDGTARIWDAATAKFLSHTGPRHGAASK